MNEDSAVIKQLALDILQLYRGRVDDFSTAKEAVIAGCVAMELASAKIIAGAVFAGGDPEKIMDTFIKNLKELVKEDTAKANKMERHEPKPDKRWES